MIRNLFAIPLLSGFAFMAMGSEFVKETEHQVLYVVQGKFADVKENVELAITEQGLVIDSVATVGAMLERTGTDLGATRQIYLDGDVFEFCSAALSREMTEADPTNLAFCPYTIHVYTIPEEPGNVYVGYRRPTITGNEQSQVALGKIDRLLNTIVSESLSW